MAGKREPLPEACVAEAMTVIGAGGIEALSLRDVARRLGVSHQAPYKHFPSRDHLLAEVIRRCFMEFASALRTSGFDETGAPYDAIDAMRRTGAAYLDFAKANPLKYRLMFATAWPEVAHEVGLETDARVAFDVLRERLLGLLPGRDADKLDLDAMFVWSTIHGIASVIENEAMKHLDFSEDATREATQHVMKTVEGVIVSIAMDMHRETD